MSSQDEALFEAFARLDEGTRELIEMLGSREGATISANSQHPLDPDTKALLWELIFRFDNAFPSSLPDGKFSNPYLSTLAHNKGALQSDIVAGALRIEQDVDWPNAEGFSKRYAQAELEGDDRAYLQEFMTRILLRGEREPVLRVLEAHLDKHPAPSAEREGRPDPASLQDLVDVVMPPLLLGYLRLRRQDPGSVDLRPITQMVSKTCAAYGVDATDLGYQQHEGGRGYVVERLLLDLADRAFEDSLRPRSVLP